MPASPLSGLGIDIISLARIRRFLKENSKAVSRLLTPSEQRRYQRKMTLVNLARLFTAKEAFFKALGESWMGIERFSLLEVRCFPHGRFRVESLADQPGAGEGSFFEDEDWVGAQVFIWKK